MSLIQVLVSNSHTSHMLMKQDEDSNTPLHIAIDDDDNDLVDCLYKGAECLSEALKIQNHKHSGNLVHAMLR